MAHDAAARAKRNAFEKRLRANGWNKPAIRMFLRGFDEDANDPLEWEPGPERLAPGADAWVEDPLLVLADAVEIAHPDLPFEEIRARALDVWANWKDCNPLSGERGWLPDSGRYTVDYLMEVCLAQETWLDELPGKSAEGAREIVRQNHYRKIAATYLWLAEECRNQIRRRWTTAKIDEEPII